MKVVDPVCGLQTDTAKAVAQEDYGGETFFFCSVECHRLFKTSPERYVGRAQQSNLGSQSSSDFTEDD